jgi:hypothetical protein
MIRVRFKTNGDDRDSVRMIATMAGGALKPSCLPSGN